MLSFRIALPDPILVNDITKYELLELLNKRSNLTIYTIPFDKQSFSQQFEIYLADFYHDFLRVNFKNYNYQKLFGKQKDGNWLTNEEVAHLLWENYS